MNKIYSFQNEYEFLSNFYEEEINYNGIKFPTAEHAFQYQKAHLDEDKAAILLALTPGKAKRIGQNVRIVKQWEIIKTDHMFKILLAKFEQNNELQDKLLATNNTYRAEAVSS